jgi:hypothetical protein|tara:strand:- start:8 stop:538 length:531 start_codon:yes stop_codon:yes gene_type:complete
MSGKITDNLGRSSGLVKAVTAAGVDTIWDLQKDGQQTVSDATDTKITSFTSVTDTDSAWDDTNNKIVIPAGKGGYYLVTAQIYLDQASGGNSSMDSYALSIYKNNAALAVQESRNKVDEDFGWVHISVILDLDATDYLELYHKASAGGGTTTIYENGAMQTSTPLSFWSGARLASN